MFCERGNASIRMYVVQEIPTTGCIKIKLYIVFSQALIYRTEYFVDIIPIRRVGDSDNTRSDFFLFVPLNNGQGEHSRNYASF